MADFLGALTADELAAFRAAGRDRRFARGEAIFHEGDDPGGVVAVVSGTVKVLLIGVGGREVVLRFSEPGELFGELAGVPGSLWMRQMVLGPSPEFVLFAPRDVALSVAARRIDVSCLWP